MVAIPLKSGAYESQSLIANAQRSVNFYPEMNPAETEPSMPVTHYPRPGLAVLGNPPSTGRGRCLYCANQGLKPNTTPMLGDLYAVIDQTVYFIDSDWNYHLVGTLLSGGTNPVYMADNGSSIIVVDGTDQGYQIDIPTKVMTQIIDPVFFGSDRADYLDSFIILNNPGTNQWYCTTSLAITPFNGLFIGIKTAWPDSILAVIANERQALILGPKKSEVWFNAGTFPFPFQIQPNIIIEHGCCAKYSAAKMDINIYWLGQSPEGDRVVLRMNSQNVAQRISNHGIENILRQMPRVDDAIGTTYQIEGHAFYKLHFPTADTTLGFDEATQQWHEDRWIDTNGELHRARNTFCAFAYGKNVALDWATGTLYQIDPFTTTDNAMGGTQPIALIRAFPHIVNELKRISHSAFSADVETGQSLNTGEQGSTQADFPYFAMRYSKNGGHEFSNYRIKRMVSSGHYRTMLRYRNMGIARDMVYEVSSTAAFISALQGAYVDPLTGVS